MNRLVTTAQLSKRPQLNFYKLSTPPPRMSGIVQQLALDAARIEAAEAAGQVHETMAMLGRSRLFVNGALLAVAHAAR